MLWKRKHRNRCSEILLYEDTSCEKLTLEKNSRGWAAVRNDLRTQWDHILTNIESWWLKETVYKSNIDKYHIIPTFYSEKQYRSINWKIRYHYLNRFLRDPAKISAGIWKLFLEDVAVYSGRLQNIHSTNLQLTINNSGGKVPSSLLHLEKNPEFWFPFNFH